MSITGGDWTVMAQPVFELSWTFYIIWYTYTAFVIFGLLNVFTGIFVESATHAANSDREIVMQAEREDERSCMNTIRQLFENSGYGADGQVTEAALKELLQQDDFKSGLGAMGVHTTE